MLNPFLISHLVMSLAIQSALSGLQSASQKFERAASEIVRGGAQIDGDDNDLVDGLVSLKEAEIEFKANAKVIGAIARTQGRLLDILA